VGDSGQLEFYETLLERSSIRRFKRTPVPDDAIHRILNAGMHSPSAEHRQHWEFIWIKDGNLRMKLAELKYQSRKKMAKVLYPELTDERIEQIADGQRASVKSAPVLIAVCYRDLDNPIEVGTGKISLSYGAAWQCIENMWLAATAEGLGFSPTFYGDDVYGEVKKLLGLPQGIEFAAVLRIGKKAQREKRKPIARLEDKLHYDKFGHKSNTAE